MAVTSVKGCRLQALCDMCVHLPLERELCPFDLAPVTSTAAQMVFGDTVAIALMQVGGIACLACTEPSCCAVSVPCEGLCEQREVLKGPTYVLDRVNHIPGKSKLPQAT